MSPRKTRRGAKADTTNESLSETISKKSKENSPPPSLRTMKTRRQLSKTISHDSEADQSLEINKSRRKTVQETPSGKSTRSRKKALVENVIDDSSNILDITTSTKKRTRRPKDKDILSEQTILLDGSTMNDDSSSVKKARATRSRKKIANKGDSKSADESMEVTSGKINNIVITKNSSIIEKAHENLTVNEIEVQLSRDDAEVQHASVRNSRFRASASTPTSPRSSVKRRVRNARAKIENFTPESSPIIVHLSPHRTTKTPRKSPMNLGSPKTHADQSHGLSKTPRKLPVVEESPTPSEKAFNDTPEKSSNNLSLTVTKLPDGSNAKKKKRSPKKKSPNKTAGKSPSKNLFVRKFSKSPKIALRTPKVKSTKNKSPRVVTSKAIISPINRRFTKSPMKSRETQSPMETSESTSVAEIISPMITQRANKSRSPKKSLTVVNPVKSTDSRVSLNLSRIDSSSNETSPRILRNTSPGKQTKINAVHQSPTVILSKISTPSVITPETKTTRISSRRSNQSNNDALTMTPVKTVSAKKRASQGGESPRRSKSIEKNRTLITDSDTPLRPTASPRAMSAKNLIGKSMIISSSIITPVIGRSTRQKSSENAPMLSSTPRERIRRSLNLSPGLGSSPKIPNSPVNPSPRGGSTLINEVRATRSSLRIEDVTNPLISEDDESFSLQETSPMAVDSPLDETFEIAKKTMKIVEKEEEEEIDDKEMNGTYELLEPVTPVLRGKACKRSFAETDTSIEERTTKRTCRVRFAASPPPIVNKTVSRDAVRSRSATPGQRVSDKRINTGSSSSSSSRNVSIGRTANNPRKRSNSMTNVSVIKTPVSSMKRRSNSASDGNAISASKTAQNASVNRLSKPRLSVLQSNKKTEVKTPAARKAPNFAQIHERKFAKMESLVDAKKRVEKRHLAINSQIPTSLSKVNTAARSNPKVSAKAAAPSVAVNGAYNRYGFKLRKNDAVKIVTKKQPTHTSEKKQNENRLLLKGVRTNRRFELIMKARNITR